MICIYNEHLKWMKDVELDRQMKEILSYETGLSIEDVKKFITNLKDAWLKVIDWIAELINDVVHSVSEFFNKLSSMNTKHSTLNKIQTLKTWEVPKNIPRINQVNLNKPMVAYARSNLRG